MTQLAIDSDIGGHLSLAFANTVEWRLSEAPQERLEQLEDLIGWAESIHLLEGNVASHLRQRARSRPDWADEALRRARLLRDVIYRVFAAQANGEPSPASDLDLLRLFLQVSMAQALLQPRGTGFDWTWEDDEEELGLIVGPIAQAAVDLLRSDQLDRVGQCADDRGCGWLFLDFSRNRSRRWCSMETCGNRAKVRRHYQRAGG